jgi:Holliday junction resolvasome RuvABC endonuclease subunit
VKKKGKSLSNALKKKPTVAGIDYSLNGPCICVFQGEGEFNYKQCSFYFLTNTKSIAKTFMYRFHGELFNEFDHECQRYESISDWAINKVTGCDYVGLEGYAYGASGNSIFQIAENCGLLKYKMWEIRIPVEVIPPTKVKKEATGKGNASKHLMVDAFELETGVNLQKLITPKRSGLGSPVTDIADAYFICKQAYAAYAKTLAR